MSDKNERRSTGKAKERKKSPAREKIAPPPAKAESPRSGATPGRGPDRDISLPVSIPITVDAGIEITVIDP